MDRPRSPAMSAPPVTSYVRTPPRKSLIYKPFENRPSLILLVLVLALSAGHPCGVPPRLRRGSPSGIKCPPSGGAHRFPPTARPSALPSGALPLWTPHTRRREARGAGGRASPFDCPHSHRLGRFSRVKAKPLRGRCASLDPPSTWRPTGKRSAQAEGRRLFPPEKIKTWWSKAEGRAVGAGGYVGEGWGAGGQSLWASSWAGAACPSACPAGLSTGRAKRASRWPLAAIVHISTGWQGSEATAQGEARRASPKGAATGAAGHDFAKQSLVSTLKH